MRKSGGGGGGKVANRRSGSGSWGGGLGDRELNSISIPKSSEAYTLQAAEGDDRHHHRELSKLDAVTKDHSSESSSNIRGSFGMNSFGIILLVRLSIINGRAGFILTVTMLALVFYAAYISLYFLNKYATSASWPSILYSINRKYIGSRMSLSIGAIQYTISVISAAAYAIAASEIVSDLFGIYSYQSNSYKSDSSNTSGSTSSSDYYYRIGLDERASWSSFKVLITTGIIICWVSCIVSFILPKKFIGFYFSALPILAVLLYLTDFTYIIYSHFQADGDKTGIISKDFSMLPAKDFTYREYFGYFSLILIPMSGFSIDSIFANESVSKYTVLDNAPYDSKYSHIATGFFLLLYSILICCLSPEQLLNTNHVFAGQFTYAAGIAFKSILVIVYIGMCLRYLISSAELITYIGERDVVVLPLFKIFSRFGLRGRLYKSAVIAANDQAGDEHVLVRLRRGLERALSSDRNKASAAFDPEISIVEARPSSSSSSNILKPDDDKLELGERSDSEHDHRRSDGNIGGGGGGNSSSLFNANLSGVENVKVSSFEGGICNSCTPAFKQSSQTSSSIARIVSSVFVSFAVLQGSLSILASIFAVCTLIVLTSVQIFDVLYSLSCSKEMIGNATLYGFAIKFIRIVLPIVISFLISWLVSVIVIVFSIGISAFLCFSSGALATSSSQDAIMGELGSRFMSNIYFKLLAISDRSNSSSSGGGDIETGESKLNWRPIIQTIVLFDESSASAVVGSSSIGTRAENLIRLAGRMGPNFSIVSGLMKGDISAFRNSKHRASLNYLNGLVESEEIEAFCSVSIVASLPAAIETATQVISIGNVSPNSVMMLWPDHWESLSALEIEEIYAQYKLILSANKTLLLLKGANSLPSQSVKDVVGGTIDIWWVIRDGGLLLLLPYLLTLSKQWSATKLRLFVVLSRIEDNPEKFRNRAIKYMKHVRIEAEVHIVDISSASGDLTWVYEQTIDSKMRMMLLRSMNSKPTISMAIQADTVWGGGGKRGNSSSSSSAKVPHINDIFNLNLKKGSSFNSDNDDDVVDGDDYDDANDDYYYRNSNGRKGSSSSSLTSSSNRPSSQRHLQSPSSMTSSSYIALSTPSNVTVSKYLMSDPESVEAGLREESKRISQKYNVDSDRLFAALLLNREIKKESKASKLLVTNFPLVKRLSAIDTLTYVDTLAKDLAIPILLVRGSGNEFITSF